MAGELDDRNHGFDRVYTLTLTLAVFDAANAPVHRALRVLAVARRRRVEDQHHPAAALRGRRAQDVALHDVPHEFPQAAGRRAIHTRYVIDAAVCVIDAAVCAAARVNLFT